MRRKLSAELRDAIRERANSLCEYCHTDEHWQLVQFTIDHTLPISDGGTDDIENLALACFHCNRRKSDKQCVYDPITSEPTLIFNPRSMKWTDHFQWSVDSLQILPITETARITIDLLQLNRSRVLQIRQDDKIVDRHPPKIDLSPNQ